MNKERQMNDKLTDSQMVARVQHMKYNGVRYFKPPEVWNAPSEEFDYMRERMDCIRDLVEKSTKSKAQICKESGVNSAYINFCLSYEKLTEALKSIENVV